MGKLQEHFNQNYLLFIKTYANIFTDVDELQKHYLKTQKEIKENKNTTSFYESLYASCQPHLDDIYKNNSTLFTEKKLQHFTKLGFNHIYTKRLTDDEKKEFHSDIRKLCRFCSLLKTCGTEIDDMEDMALNFTKQHNCKDPSEYQTKLFTEMLSGGELSKKLLKTFSDPKKLKGILSNVPDVLRGTNGLSEDFTSMLKLSHDIKDEELKETTDQIAKLQEQNSNIQLLDSSDDDDNSHDESKHAIPDEFKSMLRG